MAAPPESRFRTAARHGAKKIAQALVPDSIIAWRGPRALRAGSPRRPIALTFDDGPTDLTSAYLDVLARFGARATFFVVGKLCAANPDLVAAMLAAGHELSGHGYTHRRFSTMAAADLRRELMDTAALLPVATRGRPLVRPPHGAISLRSTLTCAQAGFTTAMWSHDSGDARTTSVREVCTAFEGERAPSPGAIVLLHEGQAWTLRALPTVLRKLTEEGHDLVTVGELLAG